MVTFNEDQSLTTLIDHIGRGVGLPGGIPNAIPQSQSIDNIRIRTVGMCPGSGSRVLMRGNDMPDLLFTGEMSHHETLAAPERGSVVISLAHSDSARGYLRLSCKPNCCRNSRDSWCPTGRLPCRPFTIARSRVDQLCLLAPRSTRMAAWRYQLVRPTVIRMELWCGGDRENIGRILEYCIQI